jgi:dCMP deaminase
MINIDDIKQRIARIAKTGNCQKRQVGCAILSATSENVLVEASNGMPTQSGLSCEGGDCPRCRTNLRFPHGAGYDLCFCLHAEERSISEAARCGISLEGAILYSTYQPCIMCLKLIIQVGITGVRYIEQWALPDTEWGLDGIKETYERLASGFPKGFDPL